MDKSAEEFVAIAREFCAWVESDTPREDDETIAIRLLTSLLFRAMAMKWPEGEIEDIDLRTYTEDDHLKP